jgi:hypothetical protein
LSDKSKNKNWGDTAVDVVNYIYVLLICTVYVLVLHNQYYDITKTRYTWFVGISCAFIVTAVMLLIVIYTLGNNSLTDTIKKSNFNLPLVMLIVFLAANIIACFMGRSIETVGEGGKLSMHAFYGDNGRFMGLAMYLIICAATGILAKRFKGFESLYVVFAAVILFTMIMALVQHTGVDVFSLKGGIKSDQYDKFISTIGNINIFASYVVIAIGVAFGAYIYGASPESPALKRICFKIVYGIVLFVCGMTIMTANSDSAYLGLGVIMFFGVLTGIYNGKMKEFFETAVIFFAGNLVMTIWHRMMDNYPNYGGLAHKLDNVKIAAAMFLAFAVLYVLAALLRIYGRRTQKKIMERFAKPQGKMLWLIMGAFIICIAVMAVAFVIYGIKSGDSLFNFNYKWGTYRGYIWSKSWEAFKDAPLANKLFGYGNESIKKVVSMPNYSDMVEKTGRIYDNAHNEVLQYLVTLGIFGALSYIALVVSSVWYMCKYGEKTLHTYIPVFVVCGYFVQGLVNLNQPITTPLFFVFLGMGVGYASYCKTHWT